MSVFPDFSEDEIKIITDTLAERNDRPKDIQLADVELRLSRGDRELTVCPATYWEDKDCDFLIAKLGPSQYHNRFFYRSNEQFGTGRENYDDILDCAVMLLKLQADHTAIRKAEVSND